MDTITHTTQFPHTNAPAQATILDQQQEECHIRPVETVGPPPSTSQTMDEVFRSIMESKAQHRPEAPHIPHSPASHGHPHSSSQDQQQHAKICNVHARCGSDAAAADQDNFKKRVVRSTTMEEFDQLIAEHPDLVGDLISLLPEEKQHKIHEMQIGGAPQAVRAIIRTMTKESLFPDWIQQQEQQEQQGHRLLPQVQQEQQQQHGQDLHQQQQQQQQGQDHHHHQLQQQQEKPDIGDAAMQDSLPLWSRPPRERPAPERATPRAPALVSPGCSRAVGGRGGAVGPQRQRKSTRRGNEDPCEEGSYELPRTGSHLVELAEAAAAVEDADRQHRERQDALHLHLQQEREAHLQRGEHQERVEGEQLEREYQHHHHQQQQQHSRQIDMQVVMALQLQAERLASENGAMQTHMEMLQRHLSDVEAENHVMKMQLLQTCASSGIQADLQRLEQTIALHRPAQVSDEQATRLAAEILSTNKGSLVSAIQQLLHLAAWGSGGGAGGRARGAAGYSTFGDPQVASHQLHIQQLQNHQIHGQQGAHHQLQNHPIQSQQGSQHQLQNHLVQSQQQWQQQQQFHPLAGGQVLHRQSSGVEAALASSSGQPLQWLSSGDMFGAMMMSSFLPVGSHGSCQQSTMGALSGLHALIQQEQQQGQQLRLDETRGVADPLL